MNEKTSWPASNDTSKHKVTVADNFALKSLTIKERVLRYKAHLRPLEGAFCILFIFMLLASLVVYSAVPNAAVTGSASVSFFRSHSDLDFSASFVGDIMMGRNVQNAAGFYGYDSFFKYVSGFFAECDLVAGNFEHPILEKGQKYDINKTNIALSADKGCLPAIKNAGFNLLTLANNHMMDYGERALQSTVECLNQAEIPYVGGGMSLEEATKLNIMETKRTKLKVATVGISASLPIGSFRFSATDKFPGVLSINTPDYIKTIEKAAEVADLVIVLAHWGDEYTTMLTKTQNRIGKELIDAGADIVIGSHPHVIQPIEFYKDGIIFYSLGNFIMDQGWNRTKDSCIVRFALSTHGEKVFEVIPLRINSATPAETQNAISVNRTFNTMTKNLKNKDFRIESGRLYIYL